MNLALLAVAAAFTLAGCASRPASSLPGNSTADGALERDTLISLAATSQADDACCRQLKVTNRVVDSQDAQRVLESWTLDRCGTSVRHAISYTRDPKGGTFIGFSPGVVIDNTRAEAAAKLPHEFPDVWYRPGDKGFTLITFSATGKLAVAQGRVLFGEKAEAIQIDLADIKSVKLQKLAGDTYNDWVSLEYGEPRRLAGFKDGSRLGSGQATPQICYAIKAAVDEQRGRAK